jgi:hypothetical protein
MIKRRQGALALRPLVAAGVVMGAVLAMGASSAAASASPDAQEGGAMVEPMSQKLSPQAKKLLLKGTTGNVSALIQVAGQASDDALLAVIDAAGGKVRSWQPETLLLAVEAPIAALPALAAIDAVVYIDVASAYQR